MTPRRQMHTHGGSLWKRIVKRVAFRRGLTRPRAPLVLFRLWRPEAGRMPAVAAEGPTHNLTYHMHLSWPRWLARANGDTPILDRLVQIVVRRTGGPSSNAAPAIAATTTSRSTVAGGEDVPSGTPTHAGAPLSLAEAARSQDPAAITRHRDPGVFAPGAHDRTRLVPALSADAPDRGAPGAAVVAPAPQPRPGVSTGVPPLTITHATTDRAAAAANDRIRASAPIVRTPALQPARSHRVWRRRDPMATTVRRSSAEAPAALTRALARPHAGVARAAVADQPSLATPVVRTLASRPAAVPPSSPPPPTPAATPAPVQKRAQSSPPIDIGRLSEEVYRHIQRRMRIERERRGL